jgi:hypothetical protein
MEEYYFKFEFSSVHCKSKSINYYVLAKNMDDLKLFLSQHGFNNVPPEAVKLIPRNKTGKYDENCVLEPYRFKSNSSSEIFTVMTCWRYIDEAVSKLASDLSQYMLFGEAIVRRDVEIFKTIGDLIQNLGVAHVIDFSLCDVDNTNDSILSNREIRDMHKKYCQRVGAPTEDTDVVLTYERLFDSVDNEHDDVLPITIECYISNFTEMMMDVFE